MHPDLDPDWQVIRSLERAIWGERWLVQHQSDATLREYLRIEVTGEPREALTAYLADYQRLAEGARMLGRVDRIDETASGIGVWTRYRAAETLEERHRRGDLTLQTALRVLERAAEALDALAKYGLFHGDLRPSCIDVATVAPVLHGAGFGRALPEGTLQGQDRYRAPECRLGPAGTPRADQYALAIIAAEVLFGALPSPGTGPERDAEGSLLCLQAVPEPARAVLVRATSLDPTARWPRCRLFMAALKRALADRDGVPPLKHTWLHAWPAPSPPRLETLGSGGAALHLIVGEESFPLPQRGRRLIGFEAWIDGDWAPVALSIDDVEAAPTEGAIAMAPGLCIDLDGGCQAVFSNTELKAWSLRRAPGRPVLITGSEFVPGLYVGRASEGPAFVLPPGVKAGQRISIAAWGERWRIKLLWAHADAVWWCDRLPMSVFPDRASVDRLLAVTACLHDELGWLGRVSMTSDAVFVMYPEPSVSVQAQRHAGDTRWQDLLSCLLPAARQLDALARRGLGHGHVALDAIPSRGEVPPCAGYSSGDRAGDAGVAVVHGTNDFHAFVCACLRFRVGREAHVETFLRALRQEPSRCLLPPVEQAVWHRALTPATASSFAGCEDFLRAWHRAVHAEVVEESHGNVLSLADYRALFQALPRPTEAQIDAFIEYATSRHSWYKHLPLDYPGVTFCFYLDPAAGLFWTEQPDGGSQPQVISTGELTWHPYAEPTADYRREYSVLDFASSTVAQIGVPCGSVSPDGAPARWRVAHLPPVALAAGSVELTAVVHERAHVDWVWSHDRLGHDELYGDPASSGWPAVSGGADMPRAIALLMEAVDRESGPPWITRFRPPIELLIEPERRRQREAIRSAIVRVVDLVWPR